MDNRIKEAIERANEIKENERVRQVKLQEEKFRAQEKADKLLIPLAKKWVENNILDKIEQAEIHNEKSIHLGFYNSQAELINDIPLRVIIREIEKINGLRVRSEYIGNEMDGVLSGKTSYSATWK